MGDKDVASSGDKAHPKVFDVTRRVASAVSGSLSGTLIGSIVQVRAQFMTFLKQQ